MLYFSLGNFVPINVTRIAHFFFTSFPLTSWKYLNFLFWRHEFGGVGGVGGWLVETMRFLHVSKSFLVWIFDAMEYLNFFSISNVWKFPNRMVNLAAMLSILIKRSREKCCVTKTSESRQIRSRQIKDNLSPKKKLCHSTIISIRVSIHKQFTTQSSQY